MAAVIHKNKRNAAGNSKKVVYPCFRVQTILHKNVSLKHETVILVLKTSFSHLKNILCAARARTA